MSQVEGRWACPPISQISPLKTAKSQKACWAREERRLQVARALDGMANISTCFYLRLWALQAGSPCCLYANSSDGDRFSDLLFPSSGSGSWWPAILSGYPDRSCPGLPVPTAIPPATHQKEEGSIYYSEKAAATMALLASVMTLEI